MFLIAGAFGFNFLFRFFRFFLEIAPEVNYNSIIAISDGIDYYCTHKNKRKKGKWYIWCALFLKCNTALRYVCTCTTYIVQTDTDPHKQ